MAKKLIETSAGYATIDIGGTDAGLITVSRFITVSRYGPDGWELPWKTWTEKYGYERSGEPLADFLVYALGVGVEEAAEIAQQITSGPIRAEWEQRGGEGEARGLSRRVVATFVVAAVVAVLVLTGFVLLIWSQLN